MYQTALNATRSLSYLFIQQKIKHLSDGFKVDLAYPRTRQKSERWIGKLWDLAEDYTHGLELSQLAHTKRSIKTFSYYWFVLTQGTFVILSEIQSLLIQRWMTLNFHILILELQMDLLRHTKGAKPTGYPVIRSGWICYITRI